MDDGRWMMVLSSIVTRTSNEYRQDCASDFFRDRAWLSRLNEKLIILNINLLTNETSSSIIQSACSDRCTKNMHEPVARMEQASQALEGCGTRYEQANDTAGD